MSSPALHAPAGHIPTGRGIGDSFIPDGTHEADSSNTRFRMPTSVSNASGGSDHIRRSSTIDPETCGPRFIPASDAPSSTTELARECVDFFIVSCVSCLLGVCGRVLVSCGFGRFLDTLFHPRRWAPDATTATSFPFSAVNIRSLCKQVIGLFREEPSLITTRAPMKVFGDIHGQYSDLLSFFLVHGQPYPPTVSDIQGFRYLFNGDFVDRGPHSLEVVCVLFALKVVFPKQVFLLRGNHESSELNRVYGFLDECRQRFPRGEGVRVWEAVNTVFNQLPVAALIDDKILVVHGGIGPHVNTLADIAGIPKGKQINDVSGLQRVASAF
jgi:hypothetical protein